MSDETSRELLASLTATLAELETGASGSDPTAAARAFWTQMMQRRRLERDRAAKAALAEATRPPERPWFDEALPTISDEGVVLGVRHFAPPRVADAPLRPPRERLSRVPRPKAPRRRHRGRRCAARPSARPSPARSSSRRRARAEPTPSRESSAYSSTEPTTPVSAKRPKLRDAASVSEAPDARDSAGATPLMIA